MSFPKRLAKFRKEKGLTQQALADSISVHLTQVNRYEAGDTQPTLEVIKKMAIALGVSADALIFGEHDREPKANLKLQFEAISQFDEEDMLITQGVLEGLILKHQVKQSMQRQVAAKKKKQ